MGKVFFFVPQPVHGDGACIGALGVFARRTPLRRGGAASPAFRRDQPLIPRANRLPPYPPWPSIKATHKMSPQISTMPCCPSLAQAASPPCLRGQPLIPRASRHQPKPPWPAVNPTRAPSSPPAAAVASQCAAYRALAALWLLYHHMGRLSSSTIHW